MTKITSTPSFIISELEKHGLSADLEDTGGGCTAVVLELKHSDPAVETAYVMITDVSGTTADLDELHKNNFLGWVAGYYPSEEDRAYGENTWWVHAQAYEREREVIAAHDQDGYEAGQQVLRGLRVDWREDALLMVTGIVNYLADLEDSRG